jgi:hypothetical protein
LSHNTEGGNANSELAEMDPDLRSYTLWGALTSAKFYLIFFSFFIGGGSGILLIDNVGQIVCVGVGSAVLSKLFLLEACADVIVCGVMKEDRHYSAAAVLREIWQRTPTALQLLIAIVFCAS